MGRFDGYILVSDYDYTMTGRNDQVPSSNLEAVEFFMANGGIFTLATGRSLPTCRLRFQEIPVNGPWIVYNGGACYDSKTEQLLYCHPLPEDAMPILRTLPQRYPQLRQEFHTTDAHYIFGPGSQRSEYLESVKAKYYYVPWEEVPDPKLNYCLYSVAPNSWLMSAEDEEAKFFVQLEQELNAMGKGKFLALNSLPAMVEIQAAGVSKGRAARDLANAMGRTTLICAGDAVNDLSMLQEADLAYIPSDCDSRLKNRGFREAAPCGEGTLADIIAKL